MAITQGKSRRKPTGGRYKRVKGKKKHTLGSLPTNTNIGSEKKSKVRTMGGNQKVRVRVAEKVNIFDKKTKKYVVAKIISVENNPANQHFTRRNIITKGALIKTDKGMAIVSNRPGQEGAINAVLKE